MSIIPSLIYMGLISTAVIKNQISNNKINKINVKTAAKMIYQKSFDYILDVRSLDEFEMGSLDNVLFYESLASNHNLINQIIIDIPNFNSKILIYCRSGSRAFRAAKILINGGYTNITVVTDGGYTELSKTI